MLNETLWQRILTISRELAESTELEPMLVAAMDEALDLVGADRGYLVLLAENGTLDFKVHRTKGKKDLEQVEDQISTSILAQVVQSGEPLILADASAHHSFGKAASVVALNIRSVMCVPLIARGKVIGALYVENRTIPGRFSEDKLPPLVIFANQAAVLIENALILALLETRVADRTGELQQALEHLEHSWVQSVEANHLRTALLANITHDIRAPLAMATSALSMMLDGTFGDLNASQTEWTTASLKAVNHVLDLSNDIFDLTKEELGELKLHPEKIALNVFFEGIVRIARGMQWASEVTFQQQIAPDLPTVYADPVRLRQVLLNLLTNALKFTSKGSVTLFAENVATHDGVIIGVKDTGDGIPADQIERLFKRFTQVDSRVDKLRLGTGLGLAISRSLVEMHGGHISVNSVVGEGSNFSFFLPLKIVSPPQQST
jgi:signal transduction histidine kinase